MTDYKYINDLLVKACEAKKSAIVNRTFEVISLTMPILADGLIKIGDVKREDLLTNTYIAIIPGGITGKHYAVVALELQDNTLKIAAYAEEGILNQHTSEGVINEIEGIFSKYIRKDQV